MDESGTLNRKRRGRAMSNEDMIWVSIAGAHPNELGLLPAMVDRSDPDPAVVQFNKRYEHGGGWHPLPGFELVDRDKLGIQYPGDPVLTPLFIAGLRAETICVYKYGIVAVFQPNYSFEVARLEPGGIL